MHRPGTHSIASYSFVHGGRLRVHVIDTPGFDDTYRTDADILREVAAWLSDTYEKDVHVTGMIYLHRITDVRIGGSAMKNLRLFQKLCGPDCLPNIILATTFWDIVYLSQGAEREKELINADDFWGFMHSRGSAVLRHSGSQQSGMAILEWSLRNRRRLTLQIQREINTDGIPLDETAAGQEVINSLLKQRRRYEREMEQLRQDMEEALNLRDREWAKELEKDKSSISRLIRDNVALENSL